MANYHKDNPGFEDSDYTAEADYNEELIKEEIAGRAYDRGYKRGIDDCLKILLRFKSNAGAQSQASDDESRLFHNGQYKEKHPLPIRNIFIETEAVMAALITSAKMAYTHISAEILSLSSAHIDPSQYQSLTNIQNRLEESIALAETLRREPLQ